MTRSRCHIFDDAYPYFLTCTMRAVEVADRLAFAATCDADGEAGWDSLMQFADQMIAHTEPCFPLGWKTSRDRPAQGFRRVSDRD
jgi:hypothetical protein